MFPRVTLLTCALTLAYIFLMTDAKSSRSRNFRVAYTAKDYLKTQGHDIDIQMVCKEPFSPSGQTCYLVSPEPMKFEDADKFCASAGSSLVATPTREKLGEVQRFLNTRPHQGGVWIAGRKKSGKWQWSGSGGLFQSTFWASGQPGRTWKLWDPKDFLTLSPDVGFMWKNEANSKKLHVLCEQNDPLLAAACPDGTIFRGQCYTISHEKKTWLDARSQCEATNGDIVMVDKKPVYRFLENQLLQIFGPPISNTIWTFEYKVANGFWINIWKAVTRLFGAGEECSLFDRDTGEVSIVDCGTKHPYACVFEDRAKFPVNCIEHEGKCYNVYSEPKPARDAQLACQGINSERLKITEEAQEDTLLRDLFQDGNGTPERGLWLDSHVEGDTQVFKTGLSKLFDELFYLHMEKGTDKDSVCNVLNHDRGSLDSRQCDEKHYFACEYGVQDDPYAVARINEEVEELERRIQKANGAFLHTIQSVNERNGEKSLYQVDIRLTPEQEAMINGDQISETDDQPIIGQITSDMYLEWLSHHHKRNRRNAVLDSNIWSSGKVPYTYGSGVYSEEELALLQSAINQIATKTCLQFVPRTTENDFIVINNTGKGCYSFVGRVGGAQELSLSSACITETSIGTIQHEILHSLGLYHEQSRYDRDNWVSVNYGNVAEGYAQNFDKIPSHMMSTFDLPYDYDSVMHYPENAFAKDASVPTIIPLQETYAAIGQREGPSNMDYLEINTLYQCQMPENGGWDFWSPWSPCSSTCGKGQRSRTRECTRPVPSNGGRFCRGDSTETGSCMTEACPSLYQGHVYLGCWNDQVLPTLLETMEGTSIHLIEPYPTREDSVKKCAEAAREKGYTIFALRLGGKCFAQTENDDPLDYKSRGPSSSCKDGTGDLNAIDVYRVGSGPVDGDYSPWEVFAPCSVSCGGGERVLTRTCTNPSPSLLGKACEEADRMTEICNTNPCPVDGGWSEWGNWSECSQSCGTAGFKSRPRQCNNPGPQFGGRPCGDVKYDGVEIRECNRKPCISKNVEVSTQEPVDNSAMSFSMEHIVNGTIDGRPSPLDIQGEVTLTSNGRDGNGLFLNGGFVRSDGATCLNNPSECPDGFAISLFLQTDIGHVRTRDRPTYVFTSGVQSEEVETDDHLGLAIYFRQDGMLKATLRTDSIECTADLPASLFSDKTRFYHVAVTFSSELCLTAYYQGLPIDNDVTGRVNENVRKPVRDSFLLGKSFEVDGHEFQGVMDEVKIWRSSLSKDEVYKAFRSVPHQCVDCDVNAECSTSSCTCQTGYIGDGVICNKVQAVSHDAALYPFPDLYLPLDIDDRPEVQETEGVINSAVSFDGRRDWVNAGNFPGECLSYPDACVDGVTVSFWLRYFGRGDRPNYVISTAAQGKATGLDIFVDDNVMNVTLQTTSQQFTSLLPTTANLWSHYTVVWSNATGLHVYVDGVQTKEGPTVQRVNLTESEHTKLAVAQPNNCFVLNGRFLMDDLAVWLQALTSEQVTFFFNSGGEFDGGLHTLY